ncbi:MAG TPA: DUF2269 family protein [Anaerolineales bacterium]|nr:DUF2269 family protein [Anaerolineales bacterium]
MSLYLILRLLHISAVIVFVGGLFARQVVRSLISRAQVVSAIATLTEAAGRVERWMVIPGNILAIVFGLILALATRAPILGALQGSQANWLLVSIVLLAVLFPLVPIVFLPRGKIFEASLQQAVASGRVTPELRERMNDPVVRWAHTAEMVGVILIVFLMVVKPF